jgi:hypothetical protein
MTYRTPGTPHSHYDRLARTTPVTPDSLWTGPLCDPAILDYVLTVERENPDRMMLLHGARRLAIVNLPWNLKG